MNVVSKTSWLAISPLLDELLAADETQRAELMAQLQATDPARAEDVARLLEQQRTMEAERFLEGGAMDVVARAAVVERAEGDRVGPYRLLRPLGSGGMGVVWLADRVDGAFKRQVALKLPLITGSPALRERLLRERDLLAALEHPNIARLYDAGLGADGQPYLALEYVEGQPIDVYCRERAVAVPARLALFRQVGRAVAHAHACLTLHRDLKPGNILVTADGQVRLLDFGVAKLLESGGTTRSQLTELAGRALTPEYASPEQILDRPLTVASDVYALGVVFYELLTAQRPYKLKNDSRRGLEDEILAADPPPPSSVVADPTLRRELAGDLDTIALKALKKAPEERYASALAMVEDIERYLKGAPILAHADSRWYRARKLVRRHRSLAAAGALALAAIVVGGAVALWQAGVAREQARTAQREALHAQTVQRFLLDIFGANTDQQADPVKARATTARELLDIGARRAIEGLQDDPDVRADVAGTLADMYAQMRLSEQAVQMRRVQVDATRRARGATDPAVARALLTLTADIGNTNQRGELPQLLDEAERILDAAGDRTSNTRGRLLVQRADYFRYVSLARMRADADAAAVLFRERHPDDADRLHALRLAALARLLGGEVEQAERLYVELLEVTRRLFPDAPAWQTTPLVELAETRARLGRIAEAEADYRRAWELSKQINGTFNADALQTQAKLGGFLHATGRRAAGRAMLFDALHALGREPGNDPPNTVGTINARLGFALTRDGRFDEAATYLAAEAADLRAHYPASQPLRRILIAQAELLTATGRYAQARALLDEADGIWNRVEAAARPAGVDLAQLVRARLLLAEGRADEARAVSSAVVTAATTPLDAVAALLLQAQADLARNDFAAARAAAELARERLPAPPARAFFVQQEAESSQLVGAALRAGGETRSALEPLQQAVRLLTSIDDARSPWLARAQIELAQCYLDLGERSQAMRLRDEARAIHAAHKELGEQFRAPLRALETRLARKGN